METSPRYHRAMDAVLGAVRAERRVEARRVFRVVWQRYLLMQADAANYTPDQFRALVRDRALIDLERDGFDVGEVGGVVIHAAAEVTK